MMILPGKHSSCQCKLSVVLFSDLSEFVLSNCIIGCTPCNIGVGV